MKVQTYILREEFKSYNDYDVTEVVLLQFEKMDVNRHVKPICLPNIASDYTRRRATISGWGKVKEDSRGTMVALRGKVMILPSDSCQEEMIGVKYFDSMNCYGMCEVKAKILII